MCSLRGVRADTGRANGDGGGITRPVGAFTMDSGRFLLVGTPSEEALDEDRLLDLDVLVRGEDGLEEVAGAVDVNDSEDEALEVVAIDSVEGCEVRAGFSKVKRVPVGSGVMRVGESFDRKSR